MSHFAEIDNNNIVLRVLVGPNYGDEGQAFFEGLGGRWVKTSYNKVAGVVGYSGKIYDPVLLEQNIKSKPPIFLMHGDVRC